MHTFKDLKIGFIGFGNMAQAIAFGFLREGVLEGGQIYACARNYDKLRANTESRGINPCETAAQVAEASDIVFIAVKPYMVADVVSPVAGLLQNKIVISVAAGVSFDDYEAILAPGTRHITTLPNTPVSVGRGIFILEDKHSLGGDFELVSALLSTISLVQTVDSAHVSIAGTIAGCGPAFVSMFIEALGDAGVMHGLTRPLAYQLAGQMVAGTGSLLVETGSHPGAMKDAVCSPGGTTIVGVTTLERKGLRSAVIDAIDAIENR